MAGAAVMFGRFGYKGGSETVLELTYRIRFGENIFLQPDLQYIINPSGNRSGTPRCLAGYLRLGVAL
jgi:porin